MWCFLGCFGNHVKCNCFCFNKSFISLLEQFCKKTQTILTTFPFPLMNMGWRVPNIKMKWPFHYFPCLEKNWFRLFLKRNLPLNNDECINIQTESRIQAAALLLKNVTSDKRRGRAQHQLVPPHVPTGAPKCPNIFQQCPQTSLNLAPNICPCVPNLSLTIPLNIGLF